MLALLIAGRGDEGGCDTAGQGKPGHHPGPGARPD
jgi:hypothetical protein